METEFKDVFLKEFVRQLAYNSIIGKNSHKTIQIKSPNETTMQPSILPRPTKKLPIIPIPKERKIEVRMTKEIERKPSVPIPRQSIQTPQIEMNKFENEDFGVITPILTDPRVEAVECPGPNKNLLVRKDGTLLNAKIRLTKEEIDKVISRVSEKTRVPIIGGIFKALMEKYIFTAVMSEFAGTSFIIQKRNPLFSIS